MKIMIAVDTDGDHGIVYALVDISDASLELIRKRYLMAKECKKQDDSFDELVFFSYAATYYSSEKDFDADEVLSDQQAEDLEEYEWLELTDEEAEEIFEDAEEDRVEMEKVAIDETHIVWEAFIKDSDTKLHTRWIDLELLIETDPRPRQKVAMKDLGALMQHWHSSMGDPIYAVGSYYFAEMTYPDPKLVVRARDSLAQSLNVIRLHKAQAADCGWGMKERKELITIIDGLNEIIDNFSDEEKAKLEAEDD